MKKIQFNSDRLSAALGMNAIDEVTLDLPDSHDHYGGWDDVNNSEYVHESRLAGGQARAVTLPEHNRSEKMRLVTSERNKKYNVGNKHHLGVAHSEETRKRISENNGSRGSKWMTLDDVSKKIPSVLIESHLRDGWRYGRVMR